MRMRIVRKIVTVVLALCMVMGLSVSAHAETQWVYPPGINYGSLVQVAGMSGPNGEAVFYEPGTGNYYYFVYQQPATQPTAPPVSTTPSYTSGQIPVGSSGTSGTSNKLFDEAKKKANELKDWAKDKKYSVTVSDMMDSDTLVQKNLHFVNKSGRNYMDVFMEVEKKGDKYETRYWVGNTTCSLDSIKDALKKYKDN